MKKVETPKPPAPAPYSAGIAGKGDNNVVREIQTMYVPNSTQMDSKRRGGRAHGSNPNLGKLAHLTGCYAILESERYSGNATNGWKINFDPLSLGNSSGDKVTGRLSDNVWIS